MLLCTSFLGAWADVDIVTNQKITGTVTRNIGGVAQDPVDYELTYSVVWKSDKTLKFTFYFSGGTDIPNWDGCVKQVMITAPTEEFYLETPGGGCLEASPSIVNSVKTYEANASVTGWFRILGAGFAIDNANFSFTVPNGTPTDYHIVGAFNNWVAANTDIRFYDMGDGTYRATASDFNTAGGFKVLPTLSWDGKQSGITGAASTGHKFNLTASEANEYNIYEGERDEGITLHNVVFTLTVDGEGNPATLKIDADENVYSGSDSETYKIVGGFSNPDWNLDKSISFTYNAATGYTTDIVSIGNSEFKIIKGDNWDGAMSYASVQYGNVSSNTDYIFYPHTTGGEGQNAVPNEPFNYVKFILIPNGDGNATVRVVKVPVTGITISGPTEATVGGTIDLTATVAPADALYKAINWSSDNTKVTVSSDGKVTVADDATVGGKVTITATAADGYDASGTYEITLKAKAVIATASTVEGGYLAANAIDGNLGTRWASTHGNDNDYWTVDYGTPKTFNTVKILWEGAYAKEFKIQTSDNGTDWTDVKTVGPRTLTGFSDSDPIVTEEIIIPGGTDITAQYVRFQGVKRGTVYGYSFWEFETYHKDVTPVTSVTLDQTEKTLTVGGNFTLAATVSPNEATDKAVIWTSSNEAVATVSEAGVVTAVSVGTAVITAKSNENDSKYATCTVTVKDGGAQFYIVGGFNEWSLDNGTHIVLDKQDNGTYTAQVSGFSQTNEGFLIVKNYWKDKYGNVTQVPTNYTFSLDKVATGARSEDYNIFMDERGKAVTLTGAVTFILTVDNEGEPATLRIENTQDIVPKLNPSKFSIGKHNYEVYALDNNDGSYTLEVRSSGVINNIGGSSWTVEKDGHASGVSMGEGGTPHTFDKDNHVVTWTVDEATSGPQPYTPLYLGVTGEFGEVALKNTPEKLKLNWMYGTIPEYQQLSTLSGFQTIVPTTDEKPDPRDYDEQDNKINLWDNLWNEANGEKTMLEIKGVKKENAVAVNNGVYTYTIAEETSDRWDAQFRKTISKTTENSEIVNVSLFDEFDYDITFLIKVNEPGYVAGNDTQGKLSVKIEETATGNRATDGGQFIVEQLHGVIKAEEMQKNGGFLYRMKNIKGKDIRGALLVVDYSGAPTNTEITISDVTVFEHIKHNIPTLIDGKVYVSTADELQGLAVAVRDEDDGAYANAEVYLVADIDTKDISNGEKYIGVGTAEHPFKGTFTSANIVSKDVNGHVTEIADATHSINLYSEKTGVFGVVENAAISNVNVSGDVMAAYNDAGSLVNKARGTLTVENCINTANVTSRYSNVGGIVGEFESVNKGATPGNITIRNVVNRGAVTADEKVGGIIGRVDDSNIVLYKVLNEAPVTATSTTALHANAAGLVGCQAGTNTDNSGSGQKTKVTVEYCGNAGDISGLNESAAFFGYMSAQNTDTKFANSYNSGTILKGQDGNNNLVRISSGNTLQVNRSADDSNSGIMNNVYDASVPVGTSVAPVNKKQGWIAKDEAHGRAPWTMADVINGELLKSLGSQPNANNAEYIWKQQLLSDAHPVFELGAPVTIKAEISDVTNTTAVLNISAIDVNDVPITITYRRHLQDNGKTLAESIEENYTRTVYTKAGVPTYLPLFNLDATDYPNNKEQSVAVTVGGVALEPVKFETVTHQNPADVTEARKELMKSDVIPLIDYQPNNWVYRDVENYTSDPVNGVYSYTMQNGSKIEATSNPVTYTTPEGAEWSAQFRKHLGKDANGNMISLSENYEYDIKFTVKVPEGHETYLTASLESSETGYRFYDGNIAENRVLNSAEGKNRHGLLLNSELSGDGYVYEARNIKGKDILGAILVISLHNATAPTDVVISNLSVYEKAKDSNPEEWDVNKSGTTLLSAEKQKVTNTSVTLVLNGHDNTAHENYSEGNKIEGKEVIYTIKLDISGENEAPKYVTWTTSGIAGENTEYVINGLDPGKTYVFNVSAVLTGDPGPAVGTPKNVSATTLDYTEIIEGMLFQDNHKNKEYNKEHYTDNLNTWFEYTEEDKDTKLHPMDEFTGQYPVIPDVNLEQMPYAIGYKLENRGTEANPEWWIVGGIDELSTHIGAIVNPTIWVDLNGDGKDDIQLNDAKGTPGNFEHKLTGYVPEFDPNNEELRFDFRFAFWSHGMINTGFLNLKQQPEPIKVFIHNYEELQDFAQKVNSNDLRYQNAEAYLLADIVMTPDQSAEFVGIGYHSVDGYDVNKSVPFMGSFKSIKTEADLNSITYHTITFNGTKTGLFGEVAGGASIEGVYTAGTVTNTDVNSPNLGGLIDHVTGTGTVNITHCVNSANINGYVKTAGIIGRVQGRDADHPLQINLTSVLNEGNITANGSSNVNAAGIIGCSTAAAITARNIGNVGTISGANESAAFFGYVDKNISLANCYNGAKVTGMSTDKDGNYLHLYRPAVDSEGNVAIEVTLVEAAHNNHTVHESSFKQETDSDDYRHKFNQALDERHEETNVHNLTLFGHLRDSDVLFAKNGQPAEYPWIQIETGGTSHPVFRASAEPKVVFISTADELQEFAKNVNSGDITYQKATVYLVEDIDTKDITNGDAYVGIGTGEHPFSGTFTSVVSKSDLTPTKHVINLNDAGTHKTTTGVFNEVKGVDGNKVVIEGIYTTGKVEAEHANVGGVVNHIGGGDVEIKNCVNAADVTGTEKVGGIVGLVSGTNKIDLKNVLNEATITATSDGNSNNAAGIIGCVTGATLDARNIGNAGPIVGGSQSAALFGWLEQKSTITNAYNSAKVSGMETDQNLYRTGDQVKLNNVFDQKYITDNYQGLHTCTDDAAKAAKDVANGNLHVKLKEYDDAHPADGVLPWVQTVGTDLHPLFIAGPEPNLIPHAPTPSAVIVSTVFSDSFVDNSKNKQYVNEYYTPDNYWLGAAVTENMPHYGEAMETLEDHPLKPIDGIEDEVLHIYNRTRQFYEVCVDNKMGNGISDLASTEMDYIHIDIYPVTDVASVTLQWNFNSGVSVDIPVEMGKWNSIDIPISQFTQQTIHNTSGEHVVNFVQFGIGGKINKENPDNPNNVSALPNGTELYIDNLFFWSDVVNRTYDDDNAPEWVVPEENVVTISPDATPEKVNYTNANLTVKATDDHGGVTYEVYDEDNVLIMTQRMPSGVKTDLVISGLEAAKDYKFSVKVKDDKGHYNEETKIFNVHTAQKPENYAALKYLYLRQDGSAKLYTGSAPNKELVSEDLRVNYGIRYNNDKSITITYNTLDQYVDDAVDFQPQVLGIEGARVMTKQVDGTWATTFMGPFEVGQKVPYEIYVASAGESAMGSLGTYFYTVGEENVVMMSDFTRPRTFDVIGRNPAGYWITYSNADYDTFILADNKENVERMGFVDSKGEMKFDSREGVYALIGVTDKYNQLKVKKFNYRYEKINGVEVQGYYVPKNTGVLIFSREKTQGNNDFATKTYYIKDQNEPLSPAVGVQNRLYASPKEKGLVDANEQSPLEYEYFKMGYKKAATKEGLKFYWGVNGGGRFTMSPGLAYLKVPAFPKDEVSGAKSIMINMFETEEVEVDDIVTGIDALDGSLIDWNEPVYNISGQRVSRTAKGVLIQNGMKHVVK